MTLALADPSISCVDSEMSLIGAAMFDPTACAEAFERVQPRHFHEPTWALAWEHLRKGALLDPILLAARMGDHPGFKELGGADLLADMAERASTFALAAHAHAVVNAASRREIVSLAESVAAQARADGDAEALVAALERGCAEIARDGGTAPAGVPIGLTALENTEAAMRGDFRGASSGLACLDRVTGGLKTDDVWVFGGRTSMGKSVIAACLARNIAEQRRGVLMFSLEMSVREVQARCQADWAYEPGQSYPLRFSDILKGRIEHGTLERARASARHLATIGLCVDQTAALTIDEIRARAMRQVRAWEKAKTTPGAIVIDHIGLIRPVRKTDSKAADTSDTVNELKALAKQCRCPVIAFAQINRNTESRNDKRPTLADLNWSGSIEQIADFICLLYRQSYYDARSHDPDDQDRAGVNEHDLELIVAKNRSGPICTVKAFADVACNAIRDLPDDWRRSA